MDLEHTGADVFEVKPHEFCLALRRHKDISLFNVCLHLGIKFQEHASHIAALGPSADPGNRPSGSF